MPLFDFKCEKCGMEAYDKLFSTTEEKVWLCGNCHIPMVKLPSVWGDYEFKGGVNMRHASTRPLMVTRTRSSKK